MPFISNVKIDLIYLIQYASQIHILITDELGIDDIQRMNLISESILCKKKVLIRDKSETVHISINVSTHSVNSIKFSFFKAFWALFRISLAAPLHATICTLCLRAILVHSSSRLSSKDGYLFNLLWFDAKTCSLCLFELLNFGSLCLLLGGKFGHCVCSWAKVWSLCLFFLAKLSLSLCLFLTNLWSLCCAPSWRYISVKVWRPAWNCAD